MPTFRFYYPIEVRYGDLDPQGHVNNATYLTYLEQARIQYLRHLKLFEGTDFMQVGIILADAKIIFRAPILFGQPVRIGAAVTRLGNKSLDMAYRLEDAATGQTLAEASTVLVAYDYGAGKTMPIPAHWRQALEAFEELASTIPTSS